VTVPNQGAAVTADATPETEAAPETGDAVTPESDSKPRSEVPREVAAALRKANKEAETLRLQLKEYEDRDKSDSERLAERVTTAEQRADAAEKANMQLRVAVAKGLPSELVDRLRGDTEEELAADADQLLGLITPPEVEPEEPGFPDLGQGARAPTDQRALNGDPLLRDIKSKLGIR
jgi:hypothetical protein